MDLFLTAALAAIALLLTAGLIFIKKRLDVMQRPDNSQSLLLLQNQLNEVTRTLDARLHESSRLMQSQFNSSAGIIKEVTEKLVKLDETNRQVVNFADQLKSLQDILKNPKQRGVLGEYYLETVLKNVLPPGSYQMQYRLGVDEDSGKELVPDAVLFVKDKIVPVDSKFSLENYNRIVQANELSEKERLEKLFKQDLKNRIDETAKYVRPDKGTMSFAFMFIPAEGIYYDLLINQVGTLKSNTHDLIEYAFKEKKVIIVSPTSFLAYLQTVLQGLRALQIEESAKEIQKRVNELGRHLIAYETYMQKLGNHLGTTVNSYNSAYKELGKIDKDVLKIAGQGIDADVMQLERPNQKDNGQTGFI